MSHQGDRPTRHGGFTLVELLVVISIIGILSALLLPALAGAKSRAHNIACLSNLKQLQLCWQLYLTDFHDLFVPNNSVISITSSGASGALTKGTSWCLDTDARTELTPTNITDGLLFTYNRQLGIYHCPADRSQLESPGGQKLAQPRWRSYNMSQSVNGVPEFDSYMNSYLPSWKNTAQFRSVPPSGIMVFIDENEDTILDAQFGCPPRNSPYFYQNKWWDMPSNRHSQGGNLSFADGHVEHWKWKVPKVFRYWIQVISPGEEADFDRIRNAMRAHGDN